jgi:hypothetical protein
MSTEQFDYSSIFRETKGTKTIKVTKDVYLSLLYCKGMNLKESMTKTIANLCRDFQNDCVPFKCDIGDDDPDYVFMLKGVSGRERKSPTFSDERIIIRVVVDLHKALTDLKSHPEESLNMVIFRLLCSHYQNKPIYRIFTGEGCRSCDSLIESVNELMAKNRLIANNIVVELLYAEAREFRDIMIAHKAKMKPVSILFDADGNEVWSASGHHDSDEVKEELERIAVQAQPKNNVNHKRK